MHSIIEMRWKIPVYTIYTCIWNICIARWILRCALKDIRIRNSTVLYAPLTLLNPSALKFALHTSYKQNKTMKRRREKKYYLLVFARCSSWESLYAIHSKFLSFSMEIGILSDLSISQMCIMLYVIIEHYPVRLFYCIICWLYIFLSLIWVSWMEEEISHAFFFFIFL